MKCTYVALFFFVVLLLMLATQKSFDSAQPPSKCSPSPIDSKLSCKKTLPDFPFRGDSAENGTKKYCCKA